MPRLVPSSLGKGLAGSDSHGSASQPLVIQQFAMENHYLFKKKNSYKWLIFHSYLQLPEGSSLPRIDKLIFWTSNPGNLVFSQRQKKITTMDVHIVVLILPKVKGVHDHGNDFYPSNGISKQRLAVKLIQAAIPCRDHGTKNE